MLRAAAILLVVFGHYFASTALHDISLFGVDVFFVLSGFLIGDILLRSLRVEEVTWRSVRSFWVRRWFRTLPNYFVFLGINLAVSLHVNASRETDWPLYLVFLQNFFWPIRAFFRESWSLAVEEWFYLLLPLAVLLLHRRPRFQWRIFLIVVLGFMIAPPLLRILGGHYWPLQYLRFVVPLRLDSLMYGVAAAMLLNARPEWWARLPRGWMLVAAVLIEAIAWWLDRSNSFLSCFATFSVVALGIALTLPFFQAMPTPSAWLRRPVEFISHVSYSTYLLHVPFFFFVDEFFVPLHLEGLPKLALRLTMIFSVVLLSYVPYRFIELPFLRLRERRAQISG